MNILMDNGSSRIWLNLKRLKSAIMETPEMGDQYDKYITSFNYSLEDTDKIIKEMAATGKEPIGSMGNDVPVAVLSKKPYRLIQLFQAAFCPGNKSSDRSNQRGTCNDTFRLSWITAAKSS